MFPSLSLLLLPLLLTTTLAQNLTDNQISQVRSNLQQSAQQSWELGTEAEALTELDYPSLSVFSPLSLPPPTFFTSSPPSEVLSIAASVVHSRPAGPGPLIPADGAVGDPASIGVSVLLANYSHTPGGNFSAAAQAQLDYLLLAAPRSSSGAISHRADQVQLWADFVYMAPPFIAYYGAVTQNQTLLALAYEQISLYRQALRDSSGLWRHITLGSGVDDGHWATGNGWAAAGCLRVAMTIYFREIVNAVWPYQQPNGTLLNYVDDPSSFADSSSTALLASVSFRLATLPSSLRSFHTIPSALRAQTLINSAGLSTDGWLQPVVDPYDYPLRGTKSPEGQAFVLLLQAAYSEWSAQGEQGESAARAVVGSGGVGWGNVVGLLIALLVGVC